MCARPLDVGAGCGIIYPRSHQDRSGRPVHAPPVSELRKGRVLLQLTGGERPAQPLSCKWGDRLADLSPGKRFPATGFMARIPTFTSAADLIARDNAPPERGIDRARLD